MDLARKPQQVFLVLSLGMQGFKPCCNGFSSEALNTVNIILLLRSFKPCCNGFSSEARIVLDRRGYYGSRFKPCCNGFSSEASDTRTQELSSQVSNLVVMDLARKPTL